MSDRIKITDPTGVEERDMYIVKLNENRELELFRVGRAVYEPAVLSSHVKTSGGTA